MQATFMRSLAFIFFVACTGGQSGDAVGGLQCTDDQECESSVATGIEGLDRADTFIPMLTEARCTNATIPLPDSSSMMGMPNGSGEDIVCTCATASGDVGYTVHNEYSTCLVYSRSRQCLYHSDEFAGCDLASDGGDCRAVCNELTERIVKDKERTFDAEVRSNRCQQGMCAFVVEIEGICYAGRSTVPRDCTLSDDEILQLDKSEP